MPTVHISDYLVSIEVQVLGPFEQLAIEREEVVVEIIVSLQQLYACTTSEFNLCLYTWMPSSKLAVLASLNALVDTWILSAGWRKEQQNGKKSPCNDYCLMANAWCAN